MTRCFDSVIPGALFGCLVSASPAEVGQQIANIRNLIKTGKLCLHIMFLQKLFAGEYVNSETRKVLWATVRYIIHIFRNL